VTIENPRPRRTAYAPRNDRPAPRRFSASFVVGVLSLVALATVAQAGGQAADQAWRLFRNDPALNGVLPGGALAEDLDPVWMFEADDSIESTAAIVDGRVYFGSLDTFFYALDLETGAELWKFQAAAEVRSSPSVFNGVVYFGDRVARLERPDRSLRQRHAGDRRRQGRVGGL